MQIVCPSCGYEREIPDDKIPKRSVLATCPKCGEKFRFRGLEDMEREAEEAEAPSVEEPTPEPPAQEPPHSFGDALREESDEPPLSEEDDIRKYYDQEPPTTYTPHTSAENRRDVEPEEAEPQEPREQHQGDIWDRLESMSDGEPHGREPYAPHDFADEEAFDQPDHDVPWERRDRYPLHIGFVETVKCILLKPFDFFNAMRTDQGMTKPMIFAVIMIELQVLFQFIWLKAGLVDMPMVPSSEPMSGPEAGAEDIVMLTPGNEEWLLVFLAAPILSALYMLFVSAFAHQLLRLFGAAKNGFEATFRAVTYSSAQSILNAIPVIGPLIGLVYGPALFMIGLKTLHKTTWAKTFFVFSLLVLGLFLLLILFLSRLLPMGPQAGM